MPKKPADVTETELAILDVLWENGPVGVRDIVEAIYAEHSPTLHATVKSLLDRLIEKGYVAVDRSRHAFLYSAKVGREEHVARQLQQLADSHFDGALSPMLLAMVDRLELKQADRAKIRRLIDEIN